MRSFTLIVYISILFIEHSCIPLPRLCGFAHYLCIIKYTTRKPFGANKTRRVSVTNVYETFIYLFFYCKKEKLPRTTRYPFFKINIQFIRSYDIYQQCFFRILGIFHIYSKTG